VKLRTFIVIKPYFADLYYVFYLLANPLDNSLIDYHFPAMAHLLLNNT